MFKSVFTTGEVAKVCQFSQQVVIRLIDTGRLKAHRIPFSRHRRVQIRDLYEFMKANGLESQALVLGEPQS